MRQFRDFGIHAARFVVVVFCLLLLIANLQGQENGLDRRAVELLTDNCLDCHGHDEPQAGLDLAHFKTIDSLRAESDVWEKVLRRVKNGSMPPEDFDSLETEDQEFLAGWIDEVLHRIDCSNASHAGHVTIRRLNRLEYQNSIRDLLGFDFEPAASFPGDDSGYGFDNIGDVLSLPPMLMEKYLDAAETITRQVLPAPEDSVPEEKKLDLRKWNAEGGVNTDSGALAFYSDGTATWERKGKEPDEFVLRIRARGQQAGDEPVLLNVYVGKRVVTRTKIVEHDQPMVKDIPISLGRGSQAISIAFENDFYDPQAADADRRDRNLIVEEISVVRPKQVDAAQAALSQNFFFTYPDKKSAESEVARELLRTWSSRFFRRPSSDQEVDRLMTIFSESRADKLSFEKSMQYAMQAVMVSPKFLFKVERPAPADGTARELTSFELATNLSFFLWSTTPDNELLTTAFQKNLQDSKVLQQEVKRMLQSERANQLISNFAVQWLQLRTLERLQPDDQLFPDVDEQLLADMRQETELFCRELLREDRSILEFVTADFTYVNRRLALHYSLPSAPSEAEGFLRVSLSGTARGGLLTQGSILSATSNPTRTSPVKRGKWILDNLLGEPPPPAPPEVVPLEQQELTGSLKERMEQHRRDPVCASCHELMDPLGYALENFDAVGRWRTEDNGEEIDATGVLPSGEEFSGAAELRTILLDKKKNEFVRCLTEKMLIYALGRGLRYEDQCAVNDIVLRLEQNGYRFSELINGIVESKPFRQRQTKIEGIQ